MMELFGRGELGLLGGEALRDDLGGAGMGWSANRLPDDMYPASGLALAAAYHDIKTRLASLEKENSSIRRKLKHYEVQFPTTRDLGGERIVRCTREPVAKETSVVQSEATNLQQRVNSLTQELQKSKEREERLEEVIRAYEKIHLEKSDVQRDLDKMTSLAERHVERICSLETALRRRESSLRGVSAQLRCTDADRAQLHASLDVPRGRGSLQSSRSLDALSDLKLQRLEAELEGARLRAGGARHREAELRAQLHRLRQDLSHCEHCDVEWIKKAGDEQVNLALAYTELTEELGRVGGLASAQSRLLRRLPRDSGGSDGALAAQEPRPHPFSAPPASRPPSRAASPPPSLCDGPASYAKPAPSSHLRAKFQGRRSYSEVSAPSAAHRPSTRLLREPGSTLPRPRPLLQGLTKSQLAAGLTRPASARGAGGGGGGGGERGGASSLSSSPHHRPLDPGFPLATEVHRFGRHDHPPEPAPLVTPPQSSDSEEDAVCAYLSPAASPPRTLGVAPSSPRQQRRHPSLSAPAPLSCRPPGHVTTEHAQSWPSINLWMESEESAVRSCPLCQLTFPTGYPDDALIRHIDSHLENSKI